MRVKSSFTGFLINRCTVSSGMAFVMFAIFFMASSFTKHSDRVLRAKQVNLMIRQIGHRLLLQAGDSTSRVMPVEERKDGTFLLRFENEFVFSHDSLMMLSQRLLPKTSFPSGYTVTVQDCLKGAIVYGFQLNNTSPDILACSGRNQPAGCYTIEFAFPDFNDPEEQKKAVVDQRSGKPKSLDADPQAVNSKPADLQTATIQPGIDQRTNDLKSLKVTSQKAAPKPEALSTTSFDRTFLNLICGGILALVVITLLIGRFGKVLKPETVQHQNHAIIKEPVPGSAALGKFLFNVKTQRLYLGSEVISLTDKECKVLELLHNNFGELIPRETLMQKVWIDEGVITGRSLDMFVSKLRKKLSGDPELRITNVHGKGYKLEIPE